MQKISEIRYYSNEVKYDQKLEIYKLFDFLNSLILHANVNRKH